MHSKLLFTFSALIAAAAAVPLEGEGGLVVQGGNGNTRLGMFYKPIQSILEHEFEEDYMQDSDADTESDFDDDSRVVEAEIITAEQMPEPILAEETIIIMDGTPAVPELVMPGILGMLTPQRLSKSPVEAALQAVEEMIESLKHGVLPDDAEIDMELEVNFPERVPEPEFPDFGALLESIATKTPMGDTMMIEILP
ncbi:hypothetical protein ABW21_db0200257 [Orbilia brochopaga]|nr:hypothetical protein ABW21_db0200257 [Drechslerella brochopaga]